MQPDATEKHFAVVSYMPGHEYSDAHWPESGMATREALDRLTKPHHATVLAFPVRRGGHLHWQAGGRWVVFEIAAADYREQGGLVDFSRGDVIFHGDAREAREYLRRRGLPVPSALPTPVIAEDWGSAEAGDNSVILGASESHVRAGEFSLAYAVDGIAEAGRYGYAFCGIGDVKAGEWGVAVTRWGTRATAGDHGLARCDEFGTATAGRLGIAVADTGGAAIVGELGVAVGFMGGSALTGEGGIALACEDMGGMTGLARAGIRCPRWRTAFRRQHEAAHARLLDRVIDLVE